MDEARRRILARRAAFLAVATTGLVSCDPKPQEPQVCLSQVQPPPPEAGVDAAPEAASAEPVDAAPPMPCLEIAQPCLSVSPPHPPEDAGVDAADAGKAPTTKKPKARPCLSL